MRDPAEKCVRELERWSAPYLDAFQHEVRQRWAPMYLRGLLLPGERKSIEPLVDRVAPGERQQIHHFVATNNKAISKAPAESAAADETHSYNLSNGRKLLLENARASIMDRSGRLLAKNDLLVRTEAEGPTCFAEFLSVDVAKDGFVLQQRNCGGWYYILEKLEFRFSTKDGEAYLEKFSLSYIDRGAPEQDLEVHVLTSDDYGLIKFKDVNLDRLYELAPRRELDGS